MKDKNKKGIFDMKLTHKFLFPALVGASLIASATPAFAAFSDTQDFAPITFASDPPATVSASDPNGANQQVDVKVSVGDSIGLDCQNSVDLGNILGFGDKTGVVRCGVFTNNATGYDIVVGNMTPLFLNTTLEGGNVGGSAAVATQKFEPAKGSMALPSSAAWALSADGGTTWLHKNDRVRTSGAATPPNGTDFSITVGAHAGSGAALESGTYIGSFTLTATTI